MHLVEEHHLLPDLAREPGGKVLDLLDRRADLRVDAGLGIQRPDVLHLELPGDGLKGARGATLKPVSAVLRPDVPAALQPILAGLGASAVADVPRGSSARMLLVAKRDPAEGESFAGGGLLFERREVQLVTLTGWRESPDWKVFQDF